MPSIRHAGRALAALLLVAVAALPSGAQARFGGSSAPPSNIIEGVDARAVARKWLDADIAKYGRTADPAINADVRMLIDRIVNAAGEPKRDILWAVIDDSSLNAAAMPGAVMVVNVGLPLTCRQMGDSLGTTAALKRDRYLGCMAAVVGHEYGHIILGHSDSAFAEDVRAKRFAARAGRQAGTVAPDRAGAGRRQERDLDLRAFLADRKAVEEMAKSRRDERAADKVGALLMLRAGWQIQDAMDLFRRFDLEERGWKQDASLIGWLRDHPRGILREVELEQLRADLRRNQARLDDAVIMVNTGVLLDSAVSLLDRVLQDFPELPVALHARAAALHQQWMHEQPTSRLRVRSVAPAYSQFFAGDIRGAGDADGLAKAREAYRQSLARLNHPWTLSGLAVLDAYAGDAAAAREHAAAALAMAPNEKATRINVSAARLLTGDAAGAKAVLAPMIEGRSSAPFEVVFNYALASLALGDTARAKSLLTSHARNDPTSGWSVEARRLLGSMGAPVPPVPARGPAAAPALAGVRLGMSLGEVIAVLGEPVGRTEGESNVIYEFRGGSIGVAIAEDEGAVFVLLDKREAGDVEGVRVGDAAEALSKLGTPAQSGAGRVFFARDGYAIVAVGDSTGDKVGQIGILTTRK